MQPYWFVAQALNMPSACRYYYYKYRFYCCSQNIACGTPQTGGEVSVLLLALEEPSAGGGVSSCGRLPADSSPSLHPALCRFWGCTAKIGSCAH